MVLFVASIIFWLEIVLNMSAVKHSNFDYQYLSKHLDWKDGNNIYSFVMK
jgi:hypothetical protein